VFALFLLAVTPARTHAETVRANHQARPTSSSTVERTQTSVDPVDWKDCVVRDVISIQTGTNETKVHFRDRPFRAEFVFQRASAKFLAARERPNEGLAL
jgi:hypothetical protein